MTLKDKLGNPISHGSRAALDGLEEASSLFLSFSPDPLAVIDATLEQHPDFAMGHCFRAGVIATATEGPFQDELLKSARAAASLSEGANAREQMHIAAVNAWANGDTERGSDLWGRVLFDYPRDVIALQFAHLADFLHGHSTQLRDRVARVVPGYRRTTPYYGFVQGMLAFGFEESGDYRAAEAAGREAFSANPKDGWAAHAVAHVLEMEGRTADGIEWLTSTAKGWGVDSMFAYHNWWHLALFHFDREEIGAVLDLYDTRIRTVANDAAMEMVDGAALLWRLTTHGHDVGARWEELADKWAGRAEDGLYAFNDAHAMMAFIGAGRADAAHRQLTTLERAAAGGGTNAMMSREVGLPLAKGLYAFGQGQYGKTIDLLLPLRGKAARFGGSHAQRDIISWTLTEAAIRAGDTGAARALVNERLAAKPKSTLNLAWDTTVKRLEGTAAQAA